MSAHLNAMSNIRGLNNDQFNFFVKNFFNCSEIESAEAYKLTNNCGQNIFIVKAGCSTFRVSGGCRFLQKGYNCEKDHEFSKPIFEAELNSADVVLIPLTITYRNHASKNILSHLKNHSDRGMVILYIKAEENYILLDPHNLKSPLRKGSSQILHGIQKQVIKVFKELGLKGTSSWHKYDEDIPFPYGCGPAVLWSMRNVIEDSAWRPETHYGVGAVMFRRFAHQIVEFFSSFGMDLIETSIDLVCDASDEFSGAWVSDDQILAEAGLHSLQSSSSSSELRRRGLRKKQKAHRKSPPVQRDLLASVLGHFDVGGEKEVATTSRYKLRKRTVISGTDELKLRRKTREKKA
ncbi:unnamed protein product [Orchesella dallaii]|uniref:Uncharacterized protein n=1 Tax=Orchesella dallaii TaxID=48710 RepID=A0ABP1RYN7_9HEXA